MMNCPDTHGRANTGREVHMFFKLSSDSRFFSSSSIYKDLPFFNRWFSGAAVLAKAGTKRLKTLNGFKNDLICKIFVG